MNSFGRLFRISIYGESHGNGIGIVVDGCPAGLPLSIEDFLYDLSRRQSNKPGTTPRKESDMPEIISGVFNDHTTGAPINIMFRNTDTRSSDYSQFREIPRPGHADFVAMQKFGGFEDYRGGGHFSGRLTLGIVAAGVIAKKLINPIEINSTIVEIGGNTNIEEAISKALEEGDSVGGIIECVAKNVPIGLGEPFFDSVESVISHIVFSIPAIKGIEFGSGFKAAKMKGSEHNDRIISTDGKTFTNNSGGITGGITNGNEIVFRVAVKPTSSISKPQKTFNIKTHELDTLIVKGRHDTCIALRIPVVLECATAIALADLMLLEQRISRIYHSENE